MRYTRPNSYSIAQYFNTIRIKTDVNILAMVNPTMTVYANIPISNVKIDTNIKIIRNTNKMLCYARMLVYVVKG